MRSLCAGFLQMVPLVIVLLLGGCVADHIGISYAEAPRDLTSAALRTRLVEGKTASAIDFPIGTTAAGRRCGGPLGSTQLAGLPRRDFLRSSIPWATDGLLGNPFRPGETYERQLRAASIRHDQCYGHGKATYGRSRFDCDRWIRADAIRLCAAVEGSENLAHCGIRAQIPFIAVATLGNLAYDDNTQNVCEYDPGINSPRDFVLTGRFIQPRTPDELPGQALIITPAGTALRLRLQAFRRSGTGATPVLDLLLPLDAIQIQANRDGPPPDGRCLRAPCTVADAGLQPQDLLMLAPKIADLDGDGLDDVAFIGLDGLRNPYGRGHGMLAFALSLAATEKKGLQPQAIAAGFVRSQEELEALQSDGTLSRDAIRQQMDVLGQTWLTGRFLSSATPEDRRQQLLLVALRVEGGAGQRHLATSLEVGFAEFRLLDFPAFGGGLGAPRLRRTLFRHDGVYFTARERGDSRPLTELYRRFQNPPMLWHDPASQRDGVALIARDWLDQSDAAAYQTPDDVWEEKSQDRGVRVLLYGPPDPPDGRLALAARLRRAEPPPVATGCADLGAWDPDWLACRVKDRQGTRQRFLWNWTRNLNPALPLTDGSGRVVAVGVGPAYRQKQSLPQEALVFYTTPPLTPASFQHEAHPIMRVTRQVILPPRDPLAPVDDAQATEAGRWLAYPTLVAQLGPARLGGLVLFRTARQSEGLALQVAFAQPEVRPVPRHDTEQVTWRVAMISCPLSTDLVRIDTADAKLGAEGGTHALLRLSPIIRLPGQGREPDAFVIARRARDRNGDLQGESIPLSLLRPEVNSGWSLDGQHCTAQTAPWETADPPPTHRTSGSGG